MVLTRAQIRTLSECASVCHTTGVTFDAVFQHVINGKQPTPQLHAAYDRFGTDLVFEAVVLNVDFWDY